MISVRFRSGVPEYTKFAPVAQWIRASVFGTEGRRFESYPVYHCEIKSSLRYFFICWKSVRAKSYFSFSSGYAFSTSTRYFAGVNCMIKTPPDSELCEQMNVEMSASEKGTE